MDCYCDSEPATVYSERRINRARKTHKCEECRRQIAVGEPYTSTFGVWDGWAQTFCTCQHCQKLRDFITISTPCYCWSHGDGFDDLRDHLEYVKARAPDEMAGVMFTAGRLAVAIRQARRRPATLTAKEDR